MSREKFLGHIDRFLVDNPNGEVFREMIQDEIKAQTLTKKEKAQIFRNLSTNRGIGKSHGSQFNAPHHQGNMKGS